MHNIYVRGNVLLTLTVSSLAAMSLFASTTDYFHKSNPVVDISLKEVQMLRMNRHGNDEAKLLFNLDADLTSVFSWNTKQLFVQLQAEYTTPTNELNQVTVWDTIIRDPSDAHISRVIGPKYNFVDQGQNLFGRDLNVTLVWNVMPKVGVLFFQRHTVDIGKLPVEPVNYKRQRNVRAPVY